MVTQEWSNKEVHNALGLRKSVLSLSFEIIYIVQIFMNQVVSSMTYCFIVECVYNNASKSQLYGLVVGWTTHEQKDPGSIPR